MDIRGDYSRPLLVKQKKKAKNLLRNSHHRRKKLLFYFYFVIVKQKFINGLLTTTSTNRRYTTWSLQLAARNTPLMLPRSAGFYVPGVKLQSPVNRPPRGVCTASAGAGLRVCRFYGGPALAAPYCLPPNQAERISGHTFNPVKKNKVIRERSVASVRVSLK